MEEKKTKKTLTISSKKPFSVPDFQKNSQKKSFIIEKTASRNKNELSKYISSYKNFISRAAQFKRGRIVSYTSADRS